MGIHMCAYILRLDTIKMSVLPKVTYRFSVIPIKIQMTFFTEVEKPILKFIWNLKGPGITKTVFLKIEV